MKITKVSKLTLFAALFAILLISNYSNMAFAASVLPPKGSIEAPRNGSTISGQTVVRGWFLDGSGVAKIAVLVDGKTIGTAQTGLSRPDVRKAYPTYNNANSGYQYTLNPLNFTNGKHSLSVRETGKNGKTTVLSSETITIQVLAPKGSIEAPVSNSTIHGQSVIKGWFLDASGVAKVEILVDGKTVGTAQIGLSRPDVLKAFPAYHNSDSGYSYTLDTSQFAIGSQHTIAVKETGNNGTTLTLTSKNITTGDLFTTIDLRTPANITAAEINNFISSKYPKSPLVGLGQDFIDAQNKYGVNAEYLAAHAIWETGWGTTDLSVYKHNLFGWGAYDGSAFSYGYYFPNYVDCINYVAYSVRENYLDSSGTFYTNLGPTLPGVNVNYATDQNWAYGIASVMEEMKPYSASYYSQAKILPETTTFSQTFGSLIPAGQPYPSSIMANFPTGVTANIVGSAYLSLRTIPYISDSSLISTIQLGTPITVLGFDTDVAYDPTSTGDYQYHWYRVSVNQSGSIVTGWMYGGYLNIPNLLQVNVSSLPIYSSATSTTSLTKVSNGTYLRAVLNSSGKPNTSNGRNQVYLPTSTTATGWVSTSSTKQITQ